jgi:tetratricopeptide (TPR) repeat protein
MVMWQDVLEKSPNKSRARYNVGFLYYKSYKIDPALPYLVRAIELDPAPDRYWLTLNAAISLLDKYDGRSSSGMEYLKSMDIIDEQYFIPWKAVSLNNLGLAYESLSNLYLARENYTKATVTNPALDLAWYNLAIVAVHMNDKPAAVAASGKLMAINAQLSAAADKIITEHFKN